MRMGVFPLFAAITRSPLGRLTSSNQEGTLWVRFDSRCRTSACRCSGLLRYRADLLKQAQHIEVDPALLYSAVLKDKH